MRITKIWFADDRIYGKTDDDRTLWQSLLYYKRLRNANDIERENYEIDDEGIHWYNLDEDVSFESFEYDDPEPQGISKLFLSHPELNAVAIGKRLGISPNIMIQYVNGTSKPSKERERLILNEISAVGRELVAAGDNV
ncbi:MAG: DUF2442 domain-containing protein [Bacteroidales bacterium]|nr:DUF2442 domain-containing protein [Bacteroidales bacterium]